MYFFIKMILETTGGTACGFLEVRGIIYAIFLVIILLVLWKIDFDHVAKFVITYRSAIALYFRNTKHQLSNTHVFMRKPCFIVLACINDIDPIIVIFESGNLNVCFCQFEISPFLFVRQVLR